MTEETQLMAEFAASRSERAFAAIVNLHLNLVFGTALRQTGDRGAAEEITQNVFLALAAKAPALRAEKTVAGWLYRTTLNQSRQRVRADLRRQNREAAAALLQDKALQGDSIWASVLPLLDEALLDLPEKDRLAVVLHYIEQRPHREIGALLGVGEDAARKRVHRVLDQLTAWFQKRGFALSSGSLAAALSIPAPQSASAGLAASIAAGAAAAASPALVSSTLLFLMTSTQWKITALAAMLLLLGIATPLLLPRKGPPPAAANLPQPPPAAALSPAPARTAPLRPSPFPPSPPVKSIFERINEGDESLSILPRHIADQFVARNQTNAESLLAAYRVTHDPEYLRRAAAAHPEDPSVLLRAVLHDAFPGEQRAWLDRLKQSDPENALGHYLSAAAHFKNGNSEAALADLAAAIQKPASDDHVTSHMQSLEEIYLASGYTAAESKAIAMAAVELPHLSRLVEMSSQMEELARNYAAAGDSAAFDGIIRSGLRLSDHLHQVQQGGNILSEMVAMRVERRFLGQLDPAATPAFLPASVQERLAQITAREGAIRQDSQFFSQWLSRATEPELISYFDRIKLFGETAALAWLKNRNPTQ